MWRVLSDLLMLAVGIWFFAATFEPLRSRTFKRTFSRRMIVVARVLAVMVLILGLVVLYGDLTE